MTHSELLGQVTCTVEDSITQAIACIEASNGEICLVVDSQRRLVGTVTDGDVRRALLAGKPLESAVSKVMNTKPRSCAQGTPANTLQKLMREQDVQQIPIVDSDGVLVDLVFDQDLVDMVPRQTNQVVIMAGGLGTRLRPLTESVPKPMIEVGGQPILKTVLENFIGQGFHNFTICLNYLGDVIVDYFGDGSALGADITYVREEKRLGTGGALSLLPTRPTEPFFVINGDILTNTNFAKMRKFHLSNELWGTMAVNNYTMSVPYGVIDTDGERMTGIREKPKYNYLVNAGIYILSPEALDYVPKDEFFDMPSLFMAMIKDEVATNAFPIHEYWIDVGQPDDLMRARQEVSRMVTAVK